MDQTITNILEGRVQYNSVPTLQEAATESRASGKGSPASSLFGGSKARSSRLSLQRQMSLDDRKKLLLEQARK